MRIGLMIGPEKGPHRRKVAQLVTDARAAEEAGFTSLWMPQIPGDFDALTAITLIGSATDRVELGTAVLPIQTRHPVAMAQEVLSVQAVCGGRFTVGLGTSHHWVIDGMLGLVAQRQGQFPAAIEFHLAPSLPNHERTDTEIVHPRRKDVAVQGIPNSSRAGQRQAWPHGRGAPLYVL